MKKILLPLVVFLSISVNAQFNQYPQPNEGMLTGGIGLNYIDGDLYYRLSFRPEISFLNWGVGLDLNFDVDQEGNLRKENYNEFSDYLSLIRYVRYGTKHEPLFIKLGALDYYTLGHGSIMMQYNNSPTFDARKIGLVLDADFGKFGFESIYSKFGEAGVVGVRGYVRPLQYTSIADMPIIGGLETGITFASDFHERAGVTSGFYNTTSNEVISQTDEGAVSIVGFDLGLPLIRTPLTDLTIYYDFSKIISFGNGSAAGAILELNGLGLVNLVAKLERRFNSDHYLPSYFNSFYEIERFNLGENGAVISKAGQLLAAVNQSNGFYGELGVDVIGMFNILGSYQRLDDYPTSGILHLWTEIAPEEAPVVARAGYDKINIIDEADLFKLDDRSYLFFELGYKPLPYLIVSMVYSWTFAPIRDADDNIITYEPQKRIEPRVSFVYPFNFGSN